VPRKKPFCHAFRAAIAAGPQAASTRRPPAAREHESVGFRSRCGAYDAVIGWVDGERTDGLVSQAAKALRLPRRSVQRRRPSTRLVQRPLDRPLTIDLLLVWRKGIDVPALSVVRALGEWKGPPCET